MLQLRADAHIVSRQTTYTRRGQQLTGILIVGAGGHAKVVADILHAQGDHVLGYLDDEVSLHGQERLGFPILGSIDCYRDFNPNGLIIGVGSNSARFEIVKRLDAVPRGLWVNAIHPQAVIAPSVQLGIGIVVAAGVVINPDAVIGDHAIINTGATVDHDCAIGRFVHIAPGVNLAGNVQIDDECLIGIGSDAIPGCHIGAKAVVGAGSVVISDIPAGVTAKGVPARW